MEINKKKLTKFESATIVPKDWSYLRNNNVKNLTYTLQQLYKKNEVNDSAANKKLQLSSHS